jgi:hypothetical protein
MMAASGFEVARSIRMSMLGVPIEAALARTRRQGVDGAGFTVDDDHRHLLRGYGGPVASLE